jgi:hypothetical protein
MGARDMAGSVLMRPVLIAAALVCALAGCSKSRQDALLELKEEACACKAKPCAVEVGARLARAAAEGEMDEQQARLLMAASSCLAAFGE